MNFSHFKELDFNDCKWLNLWSEVTGSSDAQGASATAVSIENSLCKKNAKYYFKQIQKKLVK